MHIDPTYNLISIICNQLFGGATWHFLCVISNFNIHSLALKYAGKWLKWERQQQQQQQQKTECPNKHNRIKCAHENVKRPYFAPNVSEHYNFKFKTQLTLIQ